MAQVGIHGTRTGVSASISTFEAGEYHNGFVTLNITSGLDAVTFFFNNLEQVGDLVNKINEKLHPLMVKRAEDLVKGFELPSDSPTLMECKSE